MIAKDKKLHFIAGLGLALVAAFAWQSPLIGLCVGSAAGVAKECFDWIDNTRQARKFLPSRHDVDPFDIVFTIFGSIVGAMFAAFMLRNVA